MSTTNSRKLDKAAVQAIVASRAILKMDDEGKTLRFHIAGNGTLIIATDKDGKPVDSKANPGTPLMKRIYNLKANSQLALMNDRNRQILRDAVASEAAGAEGFSEAYNDYLNKVQVSFSTLKLNDMFSNGQLVEGEVIKITTDKGSLLTLENVRAVAVEKAGKTPAFTLADLLGEEATPETVFTPSSATTQP